MVAVHINIPRTTGMVEKVPKRWKSTESEAFRDLRIVPDLFRKRFTETPKGRAPKVRVKAKKTTSGAFFTKTIGSIEDR